jgi:predicted naringenin-chalcone synthase
MQRYEADAAGLACRAASAALHQAGVPPDAVTHLVSVSCSGFSAPGFDIELITRLPLPPGTSRTHVGFMGCHGAMNALRVAKAFAEADRRACVLVCALELCSLHHQYGWEDPETIVANALFADGAAAAVCRQADTSPGDAPWNLVDQASIVIDQTRDLMSWRIGDHGFAMTLSPRVPDVIRRHLRPWLAAWLRQHGLAVEDIGSWAVHPGGPRILQACAESLPLAPPQLAVSRDVLAAFGNMSSPTVLFILERLQAQQASRPCVMLGFGPGLAIEAALLT